MQKKKAAKKERKPRRHTKARGYRAKQLKKARAIDRGPPGARWAHFFSDLEELKRQSKIDPLKELQKRAKTRKTTLHAMDLGCGAGHAVRELARRMPKVKFVGTGVARLDRWENVLGENPKNLEWRVAHAQNLAKKFPANKFDLIYSHFGLLHANDLRKVLENIGQVLRPGGLLIFNESRANPLPQVNGLELVKKEAGYQGFTAYTLKKVRKKKARN
jgi:ubiquinone/menaquinone biosynthesis C-methylase UbiE